MYISNIINWRTCTYYFFNCARLAYLVFGIRAPPPPPDIPLGQFPPVIPPPPPPGHFPPVISP